MLVGPQGVMESKMHVMQPMHVEGIGIAGGWHWVDIGSGGLIGRWVVDLAHWGCNATGPTTQEHTAQEVYLTWADPNMDQ